MRYALPRTPPCRERRRSADDEPQDPDSEVAEDVTETTSMAFTSKKVAATTPTEPPPSTACHKSTKRQKTSENHGFTTQCAHPTRQTFCLAVSWITPWILKQSRLYWKQAITIAKHHADRWTRLISQWRPVMSTKQKGTETEDDPPKDGKTTSILFHDQRTCSATTPT